VDSSLELFDSSGAISYVQLLFIYFEVCAAPLDDLSILKHWHGACSIPVVFPGAVSTPYLGLIRLGGCQGP
jgi:hypothetical protein